MFSRLTIRKSKNGLLTETLRNTFLQILVFIVLTLPTPSHAETDRRWQPAKFISDLAMPGIGNSISRPSVVHFDKYHDEILIADTGNNRIVLFTNTGTFKFQFHLAEIMSSPQDITTDPQGFIYILGSSPSGKILHKFDFDGTPYQYFDLPAAYKGQHFDPRSLACDENGLIYVLDHAALRVVVFDREGTINHAISLHEQFEDAKSQRDLVLGKLSLGNEELLIPVSTGGYVSRFTLDGTHKGSYGAYGSKTGFLNFPVAAEAGPYGSVMVLDKNRVCVLSYNSEGKFIGEFGGMGFSPGWFYHPSLLSLVNNDTVLVGQLFESRIQICAMPEYLHPEKQKDSSTPIQSDVDSSTKNIHTETNPRR